MTILIRPEVPEDADAIARVHREAFNSEAEPRLVAALRDGGFARVSLVADVAGSVVGHILFSDLQIVEPRRATPALALAPMAVLSAHQRGGIGSRLVRAGLEAGRAAGHRIVIVLGHPDYYPRFGFSARLAQPLDSPYAGPAFMALELAPGALATVRGKVEYPPPFAEL